MERPRVASRVAGFKGEAPMDVIAEHVQLPQPRLAACWEAIRVAPGVRERLLSQAVLALTVRRKLPFEVAPIHGLIVLFGPPGTGKTTLARGLANEIAKALTPPGATLVAVDPHALASVAPGQTQKEITRLFQQTLPDLAASGPVIVLLDEVDTLVVDRQRLSLESNPIDVHRATDAALLGLDRLCQSQPNVLLLATTNFPQALDRALLSRADLIEEIGLPDVEARTQIIAEMLQHLARHWPALEGLKQEIKFLAAASEGVDGRRLRKTFIAAIASSLETARDPNRVKSTHIIAALQGLRRDLQAEHEERRRLEALLSHELHPRSG